MTICIYYKNTKDLNFNKQEHIIPAGLGGKQMLEKGIVSDEANEEFSKTELKVLRNSIIGLNRMNNGPGKRGSLKLKKVQNPPVTVIRSDSVNDKIGILLGFIFMGKSVAIPQLNTYWKKDSVSYSYTAPNLDLPSFNFSPSEINDNFINFLKSRKRIYRTIPVTFTTDKNFVHIGYYNKTWYIATSFKVRLDLNVFASDMLPILYKIKEQLKNDNAVSKPEFMDDIVFKFEKKLEMNFSTVGFLYLKTAFNALAFFKGAEYVMHNIFDEIRQTILSVGDASVFIRLKKDFECPEIESYIEKFPKKAHYIILFSKDKKLNAYVSFYGETPAVVELTNNYEEEIFMDGLICDWENQEETMLGKWI